MILHPMLRLATLLLALCAAAQAADPLKELLKEFNAAPRPVRPQHPLAPALFFDEGETPFSAIVPRRLARLAVDGAGFRLDKARERGGVVRLVLATGKAASISVELVPEQGRDGPSMITRRVRERFPGIDSHAAARMARAFLADLFVFGADDGRGDLCANRTSRRLHLRRCNHLPPDSLREVFADWDGALAAGCQPCNICFSLDERVLQDAYVRARRKALEAARLFETIHPPDPEPELQRRVQALGEELVRSVPLEVPAYGYRFAVVESQFSNATSFPTGFDYVSTQLHEAVEDQAELEFLLLHELAHNIFHQIYYEDGRGLLVNPQLLETLTMVKQTSEQEADLVALALLSLRVGRERAAAAAASILSKVYALDWDRPADDRSLAYATHPPLRERTAVLGDKRLQLPAWRRFRALDEDGDPLAELIVIARLASENRTQLLALLRASDLLEDELTLSQLGVGAMSMSDRRFPDRLALRDEEGRKAGFNLPQDLYAWKQSLHRWMAPDEPFIKPDTWQLLVFEGFGSACAEVDVERLAELRFEMLAGEARWEAVE